MGSGVTVTSPMNRGLKDVASGGELTTTDGYSYFPDE